MHIGMYNNYRCKYIYLSGAKRTRHRSGEVVNNNRPSFEKEI